MQIIQVFMAVDMVLVMFRVSAVCSDKVFQHVGRTCCLHLEDDLTG
jgi:hypothetical protein